jgi:nucleoside-diphosphate-sugar epimerase
MKSRSVSLTGATGFLGWHIATTFQRAGWTVRAIVRPGNTKPLPDGVESRESALHAAALAAVIAGTDVLVHAAALTRSGSEDVLRAINVDGTRAVIDAANDTGSRLVLISSQAANGPGTPLVPSREDDTPHPLTPYGRSKLAAETHVRADARVPWTILRPSAIYGPRDRGFLQLFRLAARGRFLLVAPPDTAFTLIHVDDAARAVVMAAGNPRAIGETFFIGHPEPQSPDAMLRQLARAFGHPYRPRRVPPFALRAIAAAGDVAWRLGIEPMLDRSRLMELHAEGFVCAVDRASDRLGFTAETPLPAGLESTLRWYRRQGWV